MTFAYGEVFKSCPVVLAAGIGDLAKRPEEFGEILRDLASHSSDHTNLNRFIEGLRVVVTGGGQSALEITA